ncbi:GHKL domain-containing protein [Maribellus comscasis]|uniref:histidine kinase n=1 Tax=Maribellus comscasis TaxID=2681766 RepID=A0A6I6K0P7_9BACT|nr:HAMP domain-containing sensor histidine kinase [Maribellus comscasis]QGY44993.1 GHKL domain-containing protein [Maribellus comscasis]
MNKKIITGLIVLMGISILGIITVQLVWMNNAIRVKNELFSRSVNDALNSTVAKLEDLHNFNVVNRMAFADSIHWSSTNRSNISFRTLPHPPGVLLPDSVKRAPQPVRVIREVNPKRKNARFEIKIDSDNKTSVNTYEYSFDVDTGEEQEIDKIIIAGDDSATNNIFMIKKDSFITNITDIDSIYSVGLVRIDSLITNLDTIAVVAPDISRRAEVKAGKLKRIANQVVTEISAWDVQNVDTTLIKKVLTEELANKDIPIDFEYAILKDSSFLDNPTGTSDSLKLLNTDYKIELYPHDIIQKNLKLAVFFPGRDSFIYRSLNWLLIASFLFSLIILVTFSLSIFYILRQKKISEMKSDFINNMTHEFKTPIATISVATDSITNNKVIQNPEKIKYFTGMIKKENTRMNRQVEDILTIARLDKKEFEFLWEPVDVHDLIQDAVQGIILQIEKREGKIETHFNAKNPVVTTDKMHCTNIIYNLLDNANKYSAELPDIKITTASKPKGVLISVEDKGIGMSKSVQSKIFERFYRQTSGNIHNVKGFGLGLSYVKAVVEANQGAITVHSEAGKGSRFDLFVPYTRS